MRLPTLTINFDRLWQSLITLQQQARARRDAFFNLTVRAFAFLWLSIIEPVGLTGINVLGYLIDKILLGAPVLRSYLGDTVILKQWDFQRDFQQWVFKNAGWNIYASLSGPIDDALGLILGIGIGLVNYLTHFLTSLVKNTRVSFNLLGEYGVFGKRLSRDDQRPWVVKIIFGMLTLPFVLAVSFISNIIDISLTTLKHLSLSFIRNLQFSYNLLDLDKHLTARNQYNDKRHWMVRSLFGLITLAPVLALTGLTNSFFLGYTLIRNTGLSFVRNIKASYNLPGIHGIFNKVQEPLVDNRHILVKLLFGLVSAPFVLPVILVTNGFNLLLTSIRHFGISWYENVRVYFNLLGENGLFGTHRTYNDTRHPALMITFDLLSSPLVLVTIALTNSIDFIATSVYHFGLSVIRNIRSSFNLLGKHGVFGQQIPYDDSRSLWLKIPLGLVTSPLVIVTAGFTNTLDLLLTGMYHTAQSTLLNIKNSYNLLGENGIYGSRKTTPDNRHLAIRIIFGFLSTPLVALPFALTNGFNLLGSSLKGFGLSLAINFTKTYRIILRQHSIYKPLPELSDTRSPLARITYGIISSPFVAILALASNIIDLGLSTLNQLRISTGLLIKSYWNTLGESGLYGPRQAVVDERHLALRIIFGILSLPLVVAPILVSNSMNLIGTGLMHFYQSMIINWQRTSNLILGQHGIFKSISRSVEDNRSAFIKYPFGLLSLPLVFILATGSNSVDLLLTGLKHWFISAGSMIRASYNLLGLNGVLGARAPYKDQRHWSLRILFGLLSVPLVISVILMSNSTDLILTGLKHTWISFVRNIKVCWNLLGRYGCFGPMTDYKDERHWTAILLFGLLSLPAVVLVSLPFNTLNLFFTTVIGVLDSLSSNLAGFYNLLGSYGSFGKRSPYHDSRSLGEVIIFGILSAPLVLPLLLITNSINLLWTSLKLTIFNKKVMLPLTIFLLGTLIVLTTGLPALLLRKTAQGWNNVLIRPFKEGFQARIFFSGLSNLLTLGLFGLGKKLFKSITGYSNRFGFPLKVMNDSYSRILTQEQVDQERFRTVIDLTKSGNLPAYDSENRTPRDHSFRPVLRFFYGVRAEEEKIAKRYHSEFNTEQGLDVYMNTIDAQSDMEQDVKSALQEYSCG